MFNLSVRQKIAALVLLIFLAIGGILIFVTGNRRNAKVYVDDVPVDKIYVYVCGAVSKPGVVTVKPGTRKFEVLPLAGGALPEADLNQINLAEFVEDGESVYIPKKGEIVTAQKKSVKNSMRAPKNTAGQSKPVAKGPFDLNTVSQKQLETIPGIGPVLAGQIMQYRAQHGNFQNYEELNNVSGIGPSKLEKFRPYLFVK